MFGACERGDAWYLSTSMWDMLDSYGQPTGGTLTFNGQGVAVQGCEDIDDWPLFDGLWDYYLTEHNEMHFSMYYEYYDSEDGYVSTTETHTLDMTLTNEGSQMVLTYDPWLGSKHHFYLKKRI